MRILTRGDLDGLTSSVLITLVESVREIRFAHPKDVQDGLVPCDKEDIVVNLPYVKGCGMWFDHHVSESGEKLDSIGDFKGSFKVAPSAARVVAEYYKSPKFAQFDDMLRDTDKIDAAQLTTDDVMDPQGWILMAYTLDPRSGLGPEFQKYFRWLVEYVKEVPLEKILKHPEVKKRVDRVLNEQEEHKKLLQEKCRADGTLIVTDFRGVRNPPVGNRFLVYALFPQCNVEARLINGRDGKVVIAAGHSIFNRTCKVNIGQLFGRHGGGGHQGAGTVQLAPEIAEQKMKEILDIFKTNKPV